jgi:probable HAF family extracellular repeat protein
MTHFTRVGLSFAIICAISTAAQASGLYTITELGTLPGTTSSTATAISDNGLVTGYSVNGPNGTPQAWVYSNGQMTPVTPIGGGIPKAINDSGQVVGGNFTSINDSGQYVGTQGVNGVLVSGGVTTILNNFYPTVINNSGVIGGGFADPTTGTGAPALYQNGQVTNLDKILGVTSSNGLVTALSNNGDAYFYYLDKSNQPNYMILKANGQQILPVTSDGPYSSINSSIQLVGGFSSNIFQNGTYTALTNLLPVSSSSQWEYLDGVAINDAGQIVGNGVLTNGQSEAFLMTPLATPEPSTFAILALGVVGFAARSVARRARERI